MVEHYKESQYDDDLTVGIDDYDEDFSSSGDHLFDFIGDEESPLTRLKSIILSIDWEITDDILRQFNEELAELKDVWREEKINLVYIQALDKISRYIYKEKASAHPNAIKLLLTFYTNLEKIVSDDEMSDNEKKEILAGDVKRFEKFKKLILPGMQEKQAGKTLREDARAQTIPAQEEGGKVLMTDMFADDDPLLNLKAIVYGIDWEITSRDLDNLAKEVANLEERYSSSKAKLIFLQGIGSLGAYISLKKRDAHAEAFTLLHSFYTGLEKVIVENLSGEAEKEVLFPEVEKFNEFKKIVEKTISFENGELDFEDEEQFEAVSIQPAFSDMPEDVHGFRAEEEELGKIAGPGVLFDEQKEELAEPEVDDGLAHEMVSRLDNMFDEPGLDSVKELDKEIALAGVNVESDADDDSDEEPLPFAGDELAPALSARDDLKESDSAPAAFSNYSNERASEDDGVDIVFPSDVEDTAAGVEDSFGIDGKPETVADFGEQDTTSIPGVDVETDTDAIEAAAEESALFDDEPVDAVLEEDTEEETALFDVDDEIEADTVLANEQAEAGMSEEDDGLELDEATGNKLDDFFKERDELTADSVEDDSPVSLKEADSEEAIQDLSALAGEDDVIDDAVDEKLASFFGEDEMSIHSEQDVALSGVDVEREDDDDSDEIALPMVGDELAPALGDTVVADTISKLADEPSPVPGEAGDVISDDTFDETLEPSLTSILEEESQVPEEKLDQLSDDMMNALLASDEERVEPVADHADEDVRTLPEKDIGEEGSIFEPVGDDIDEDVSAMLGGDTHSAEESELEFTDIEEEEFAFVATTDDIDDDAPLEELEIIEVDGVAVSDEPIAVFSEELDEEDTAAGSAALEEIDSILLGTTPPGQELPFDAVEELEDEEEVVFQAADDDFDETEIFSTTLLQEESPLLGEKLDDLAAEKFADELATAASTGDQLGAAYISSADDGISSGDMLAVLRNTIAEFESSKESDTITRLNGEIDLLRTRLTDPVEKTYIQLLTTISEHIEKYSGQPDRESMNLFHSVFDKLELSVIDQGSVEEKQESLLTETSKVLQWQQRLIARNPEPHAQTSEESLDDAKVAEQSLLGTAIANTQMNVDTALESMSARVDKLGDDLLMQKVSSVMKSELEELKLSFQEEIQRLREEIMKGRRE